MNRAGNFADVAEWIGLALALAITIGVVMTFISGFNDNVATMDNETIPQVAKDGGVKLENALYKGLDLLFVAIYIIFLGFSVMAARLIPSSPKFILITVFSLIALPFVSMVVANIYSGWASQATIGATMAGFTFIPFFMDKIVYFTLFYCFVVGIALLSKEGGVTS